MMKPNPSNLVRVAVIVFVFSAVSAAQQRLLVVGGGTRPPEAMKIFVDWCGGAKAKILVITWATAAPDESFTAFDKSVTAYSPLSVDHAAIRPLEAEKRARFVEQLAAATCVFFQGGDQNRIMDVLADEELFRLLRAKYAAGVPFGGTSAGAAVMSDPMMTGDADLKILDGAKVGVRKALGLIPNVMFDQHFLVRQRHNRLFGFIIKNPGYLGVGIDEDNAVLIEDNRRLRVIGATQVMFVWATKPGEPYRLLFLRSGDAFDLAKRKQVKK